MMVASVRVHSPNQETHDRTMRLLKDGQAPATTFTIVVNSCNDSECHDIHSEVKIEVPEPVVCT